MTLSAVERSRKFSTLWLRNPKIYRWLWEKDAEDSKSDWRMWYTRCKDDKNTIATDKDTKEINMPAV